MRLRKAPRALVFVGSYNVPVPHVPHAHGEGIHVFEVDFDAGEASTSLVYRDVENPSYIYFDERLRILYAISELWGGADGTVSALSFDGALSTVVARTQAKTGGIVPCYISLFASKYLLVANYGDGSIAAFTVRGDGHIESMRSMLQFAGSGPNVRRQEGPHTHCIVPHPSNGFVYAADLGTDRVYRCSIGSDGSLELLGETHVEAGSGPRHLLFDPAGKFAFLVHELSSQLGTLLVATDGALVQQKYTSLLPQDFQGASSGADVGITLSQGGMSVYATNRGHDSIASFSVDAVTGQASPQGWVPCLGKTPRSLAFDPTGRYLMVANQDSDSIQVFQVMNATGELKPAFSIPVSTPVCVKCTRLGG